MTGQSYRFDRILDVVENSVLKQKILFSLANNPVGLKTSDLIKAVGSDTSNVRGAIKGNGKRYSKERSLEALGLATHKETTDKGRKVNWQNRAR